MTVTKKNQKKLNAGIIGLGVMGSNHARILTQLEDVNLTSVAEVDTQKMTAFKLQFKTNTYKNYNYMLEKEDLDFVVVAVPTRFHFEVAKDVIGKGLSVLIEKPLAQNIAQCKNL